MKMKKSKVYFNKSGVGNIATKLSIPLKWVENLGITSEDREVCVYMDNENKRILITKDDEFYNNKSELSKDEIEKAIKYGKGLRNKYREINQEDKIQSVAVIFTDAMKRSTDKNNEIMYYLLQSVLETNFYSADFFTDMINDRSKANAYLTAIIAGMLSED